MAEYGFGDGAVVSGVGGGPAGHGGQQVSSGMPEAQPHMSTGRDEGDWSFLPEAGQGLRAGFDNPDSFWSALGRPEKPEGYALPENWKGEGVSPGVAARVNEVLAADRGAFMQACHACNLTGKQAESLFSVLGGVMAESFGNEEALYTNPETVLNTVWPTDTQKNLDTARRGARYAGIGDALDESGLSTNPLVLQLAKALGDAVGESSAPGGKGWTAGMPVGERAMEEMYRLVASDAYRSNDPETIRKVEALSRRVDLG